MEELKNILRMITSENDGRKHDFRYPVTSLAPGYLKTFKERMELYINRINEIKEIYSYFGIPEQNNQNSLSELICSKKHLIEELFNKIVEIIEEYLSGKSKEAYGKFSDMINDYRPYIEKLSYNYSINSKFYRMRKSKTQKEERRDMFHISFGERHLVSSQRYSIAGVPNLYLGNTSYVCWLELEKPNLDDIYVAAFSNQNELNILDFAITFDALLSSSGNNVSKDKLISFFVLFPLIFACSFKKQHSDAKFNIEYVIPNMVLQWLSSEKAHFDGIRYFSTKMTHNSIDSKGINIVLPPKENTKSLEKNVYCSKLQGLFKLTKPAHWSLLSSLQNSTVRIPSCPHIIYENVEQAFENTSTYLSSEFGNNEEKLDWLEKDFI